MTNPISKITNGLIESLITLITTKEGISILLLILTMFLFILWLTKTINKNGGFITLISFLSTIFMFWITWVSCS